MSESYKINISSRMQDILKQVRSIKIFPASVHLYDRIFSLDSESDKESLLHGLEIGWFLHEEYVEKMEKLVAKV